MADSLFSADDRLRELEDQAARRRAGVLLTQDAQPDATARNVRTARELGQPLAAVNAAPGAAEIERRLSELELHTADTPVVAARYASPEFLALAKDDVPTLTKVERAIGALTGYFAGANSRGGAFGTATRDFPAAFVESVGGVGAALFGQAAKASEVFLPGLAAMEKSFTAGGNPLRRLEEGFYSLASRAKSVKDAAPQLPSGSYMSDVESGVLSALNTLKYAGLFMSGPAGQKQALLALAAEQGGLSYFEDVDKGVDKTKALIHGAADAVAEYVGEKYFGAAGFFERVAAGSSIGRLAIYEITKELPSEVATQVWQDFNQWATTEPDKPIHDFLVDTLQNIPHTAVSVLVGGGLQVGAARGVKRVADYYGADLYAGAQAEGSASALAAAFAAAANAKLRTREGATFAELANEMASDGVIHVDAEVLAQIPPEQLTKMLPSVQDQMAAALQSGGTVAIPVGEALTGVTGTQFEQTLADNMRATPDAPTRLEAQEQFKKVDELLQTKAEEVLAKAQERTAAEDARQFVHDRILADLKEAGVHSAPIHQALASITAAFYTTMAERLGAPNARALYEGGWKDAKGNVVPAWALSVSGPKTKAAKAAKPGQMRVTGVHYSKSELKSADSSRYGTGLRGSGFEEYTTAADKRLGHRVYFYANKGTGINPEAGVGPFAHIADLNNVYDADADPLRLNKGGKLAFESAVLDAGFDGYLNRLEGSQSAQVVMLGKRHIPLARQADVTAIPQVAAPQARPSRGRDQTVDRLRANKNLPAGQLTPARWGEVLDRAMPLEAEALRKAGVLGGDKPLYKDELIAAFEAATPAETYAQVRDMTAAVRLLFKNLTPAEREKLTNATAAKVIALLKRLPASKEFAAVAFAGRAKRGWYRESARALSEIFGPDATRFAVLLAAMSPQTEVDDNLLNTLQTWKNWIAAGRPTDRAAIVQIMGRSVQGNNLTDSVLPAWINNSVRALTAEDPNSVVLSGPKVNSFYKNLIGVVDEVTNDAWMANFALVDQKIFAGGLNAKGTDPGKGPGYLAMSAKVRAAASTLTKLTGETWTPAEVQETVWSWAKALYETANAAGEPRTARQIIEERALSDDIINAVPDFSGLFHDPKFAKIITDAGYADELQRLQSSRQSAADAQQTPAGQTAPFDEATQRRLELQAAHRLDRLAANRGNARAARAEQELEDAVEGLDQQAPAATLDDFSPERVSNILSLGGWAILTASDPGAAKRSDAENATANAQLKADLDEIGAKYTPAVGKYGDVQDSFIVTGITAAQAEELGAKYGQESILDRRGLVYMRDGSVTPATGVQVFTAPPSDFYTHIPGSDTYFSVDLNFGDETLAQQSDIFYSALQRQIEALPTKSADAGGWKAAIKGLLNKGLVKVDEIEAVGLNEWLDLQQGKVPREAVLGYLQANGVQVEEVIFEDSGEDGETTYDYNGVSVTEYEDQFKPRWGHRYTLPGGERPREVALWVPGIEPYATHDTNHYGDVGGGRVVAWVRLKDRMDADGKRVLFVEEIQSKRAQEGKKQGFARDTAQAILKNQKRLDEIDKALAAYPPPAVSEFNEMLRERAVLTREFSQLGIKRGATVPDAPFVTKTDAWVGLAMRRIIKMAVDEGYDRVAFINGEQSAERYDLSKQVDAIDYKRRGSDFDLHLIKGGEILKTMTVAGDELDGAVGKDLAEKMRRGDGEWQKARNGGLPMQRFEGLDLKVGGAGMRAFYDQIVPTVAKETLRKLGGEGLREVHLAPGYGHKWVVKMYDGTTKEFTNNDDAHRWVDDHYGEGIVEPQEKGLQQPGFDITDKMRDAVQTGAPLFQGPDALGGYTPARLMIALAPGANLSTFHHELSHFFFHMLEDFAGREGAPQQVKDDFARALAWFGVTPEQWAAMSFEQKRPHQERWARGYEQYLLEGKAPSLELQPLMRRFAQWMKAAYGSLKEFLARKFTDLPQPGQPQLSDDIRRVYDRLLATDDQIAEAEAAAGMVKAADATSEALERLQSRSMRVMRWTTKAFAKALLGLQREATEVRADVEARAREELLRDPVYAAKAALDKANEPTAADEAAAQTPEAAAWNTAREDAATKAQGEVKAEWLARPEAQGLKGIEKGQYLAKSRKAMNAAVQARMDAWDAANPQPYKTGVTDIEMAAIADAHGFADVQTMLESIAAAEPFASAVQGLTDRYMLEEHGELADEDQLKEAANEAVHNEARARMLAAELKSQAEALAGTEPTGRTGKQGQTLTVNSIKLAAERFGREVIAKLPIKGLKNAMWQHTAAERRAAKRWTDATAAGKTQDAITAKRDQALQNAAARAAGEAQAEVRKWREFVKRVTKGNNEALVKSGRDAAVANIARAILRAYGFETATTKSAAEYLDTVRNYDPQLAAVIDNYMPALSSAKPWQNLTIDEFIGVMDVVKAVWSLSKSTREIIVAGRKMRIDDAAAALGARMTEIGVPDRVPGEGQAPTEKEVARRKLLEARAALRRVEQWSESMDGVWGGPFTRLIQGPIAAAVDAYNTALVATVAKFEALLQSVAGSMKRGVIDAPELGYKFGADQGGVGMNELLHAILHTGNESNKRKLLLGRNWATTRQDGSLDTSRWDAFMARMYAEGVITKAHMDFVQGVWDLLESTKPAAQEAHKAVYGRYFSEVTADALVTPFGTYRGGYVPAKVDARQVTDAHDRALVELQNQNAAFGLPQPAKGFTVGRVEYNRPLLLDLRSLAQHIDQVVLFSHLAAPVDSVSRLLRHKEVSYKLNRVDPAAISGMLTPWLNRAAKQIVQTSIPADAGVSRIASVIRARAGLTFMFANVSNALQQLTGFLNAKIKIAPGYLRRAAGVYAQGPRKLADQVAAASPYMKTRMESEIHVLNEQLNTILLDPTLVQKAQAWSLKHSYFLQAALDNSMGPIVWTAAYNQHIAEGGTVEDAVAHADSIVRQTQGSTRPIDVSRIETGHPLWRLFAQFTGYFNMMANTATTELARVADDTGLRKGAGRALYVMFFGVMAPIWAAELIAQAFKGGPDDDDKDGWYIDDWLKTIFGYGTLKGVVAAVPVVGPAAYTVVTRFNNKPYDDRIAAAPAVGAIENSVAAPASVYKAIVENGSKMKAVRDTATLATMLTGLPVAGISRPIVYATGVAAGEVRPKDTLDLMRGLVTGTADSETKIPR